MDLKMHDTPGYPGHRLYIWSTAPITELEWIRAAFVGKQPDHAHIKLEVKPTWAITRPINVKKGGVKSKATKKGTKKSKK